MMRWGFIRLWREKRGEIEPEDLSVNLIVQLGTPSPPGAVPLRAVDHESDFGRLHRRRKITYHSPLLEAYPRFLYDNRD
jgi:hypothetical protein